jgi:hypothetical protein
MADYDAKKVSRAGSRPTYHLAEMEQVARHQLIPLIDQHPYTQFEFFLPPYSVMAWTLDAEHGDLPALLMFRVRLAELLTPFPNAHLHDFQAWESLICDLDRYSDVGHYGPVQNQAMVSLMRHGTYLANAETVASNNVLITSLVARRCSGP